jgi:hypothetical protein
VTPGPDDVAPGLIGEAARLAEELDADFRAIGAALGAEPCAFPPLLDVRDLKRIDYFTSFPHLVTVPVAPEASAIPAFRDANAAGVDDGGPLALGRVCEAHHVLAPAACYALYPALRGLRASEPRHYTMLGTCFRREAGYAPLRRQWAFRMREVVHVGTEASVPAFLAEARAQVEALADRWRVPVRFEVATDPFFDPARSPKYLHQKLFPSKEEVVWEGGGEPLALGSVNDHRTYFGEAFDLEVGGATAHTACLAFGLERWVGATA